MVTSSPPPPHPKKRGEKENLKIFFLLGGQGGGESLMGRNLVLFGLIPKVEIRMYSAIVNWRSSDCAVYLY